MQDIGSRLIIIGSRGFIGSHFCRVFPNALAIDRSQLDLCNPNIGFITHGYKYALIAAGIGNPKKCEKDTDASYCCNVTGTLKLGKDFLKRKIIPIFFSTDYIFDNLLKPNPLNAYGKQKLELETQASLLDALIIRLSKVYGIEKGDGTLFDEMAAKLKANETVYAAYDQVFAPVFIRDVVAQTIHYLKIGTKGVVDIVGPVYASRFEMAKTLAEKLNVSHELVKKISLDDLKDGVQRPKFLKLCSNFPGLSWKTGIEHMVKEYAK